MRKAFFFIFLLVHAVPETAIFTNRARFLQTYYYGDYEKAHEMLQELRSDALARQLWEERIHFYWENENCQLQRRSPDSARSLALLRIGVFEAAQKGFGDDWISLAGRATLACWQNNLPAARQYIREALALQPHRSELLYAAGQMAADREQAIKFLTDFLQVGSADYYKRISAQQTIDFLRKTEGLELNRITLGSEPQALESRFQPGRFMMRGRLNDKSHVTLLVDTGAAGISLEKKDWEPRITSDLLMIGLGKRPNSTGVLGVFDRFESANMNVENAVAAISPTLRGDGIDGVAGTILFADYAILLPLRSDHDLTLFPSTTEQTLKYLENQKFFSERITLPFYTVNKMMVLKGKIKDSEEPMDILLDTGAEKSILSSATARRLLFIDYQKSYRMRRHSGLAGIGGRIENILHVRNVDVELSDTIKKSFNRMIAANLYGISEALELEIDLILGQDFLKGYTLLIDYRTSTVTFLR